MDDRLIEAARQPVERCSHDFSAPYYFCTHCHRSAEDIVNERPAGSMQHDKPASAWDVGTIPGDGLTLINGSLGRFL